MPLTGFLATAAAQTVYAASAVDATVTGANVRASMLPADARSGQASFAVAAGSMPIGGYVLLMGTGTIGARLTTPPGFNFVPWFQPANGIKVDLPGFAMAPLLGTDGTCEVWMMLAQLAGGIRVSGVVRYGTANGMHYSIALNPGGTGASGALPTVIASNLNVDRTFGVDGFWGSGADAREYVKCRGVTGNLFQPN